MDAITRHEALDGVFGIGWERGADYKKVRIVIQSTGYFVPDIHESLFRSMSWLTTVLFCVVWTCSR